MTKHSTFRSYSCYQHCKAHALSHLPYFYLLFFTQNCTFQPFIHYFLNNEVTLQICSSLNLRWVYYALILHWLENDSEEDNNDLPWGLFCKKLHDEFLEERSANVLFVVLIFYISQADFLSQNAQDFTYGWPDPAGG